MASESPVLSLPHFRNLSKNWYFATSEAILKGNSIYDKHIASPGTRLDVEEVKHLFKTKLNKDVDVSEAKPVWLSPFTDPFACTFDFNLQQFSLNKGKKFAIFICNCSSVLIVSEGTGYVLVIDTHSHPDLSSGSLFIYGIASDVALYLSRKFMYRGKKVGTLTEVAFTVVID